MPPCDSSSKKELPPCGMHSQTANGESFRRSFRTSHAAIGLWPGVYESLVTLSFHALAEQLAVAAHGFGAFSLLARRGLLIASTAFHFPEYALALKLLLQGAERLIDVVISNLYVHALSYRLSIPSDPNSSLDSRVFRRFGPQAIRSGGSTDPDQRVRFVRNAPPRIRGGGSKWVPETEVNTPSCVRAGRHRAAFGTTGGRGCEAPVF